MPSLSRIVRELELRGYMHKAADQRDLRRILATLTARGRLLVESGFARMRRRACGDPQGDGWRQDAEAP